MESQESLKKKALDEIRKSHPTDAEEVWQQAVFSAHATHQACIAHPEYTNLSKNFERKHETTLPDQLLEMRLSAEGQDRERVADVFRAAQVSDATAIKLARQIFGYE